VKSTPSFLISSCFFPSAKEMIKQLESGEMKSRKKSPNVPHLRAIPQDEHSRGVPMTTGCVAGCERSATMSLSRRNITSTTNGLKRMKTDEFQAELIRQNRPLLSQNRRDARDIYAKPDIQPIKAYSLRHDRDKKLEARLAQEKLRGRLNMIKEEEERKRKAKAGEASNVVSKPFVKAFKFVKRQNDRRKEVIHNAETKMKKKLSKARKSVRKSISLVADIPPPELMSNKGTLEQMENIQMKVTMPKFKSFLLQEKATQENCVSRPFTFAMWLLFIWTITQQAKVYTAYNLQSAIGNYVNSIVVNTQGVVVPIGDDSGEFTVGEPRRVGVGSVTSRDDAMIWISNGFIPTMTKDLGLVKKFNKIIGGFRIAQTKSADDQCELPTGAMLFYDPVTWKASSTYSLESGNAFVYDNLNVDASGYIDCKGDDSAPDYRDSKWMSSDPTRQVQFFQGQTADGACFDHCFTYDDYNAWFLLPELPKPITPILLYQEAQKLVEKKWMGEKTKKVTVTTGLYNPEVDFLILLNVDFDFESTGYVYQQTDVRVIPATVYDTWVSALPDILWFLCILILFRAEVAQLFKSWVNETLGEYWSDPWNWLDWMSILLGILLASFWYWAHTRLATLNINIGLVPENSAGAINVFDGPNLFFQHMESIQADLSWLMAVKLAYTLVLFWYALIITLRFFKGFRGQPRIAVIAETMILCSVDLLHFGIVFGIIFINFALAGHIMLGSRLREWSTFGKGINSSFRMLMGELRFDEMYKVAPISCTIWFWLFVLLVVFIFMRLLTSIFIVTYTNLLEKIGTRGFGMWTQAKGAAHSFVQNLTRRTTNLDDVLFRLGVSNDCQRGTIIRAMGNKDGALKGVLYLPEVTEDELREKLSIDRWNARRLLLKAQEHYRNTTEEEASGNVVEKLSLGVETQVTIINKRINDMQETQEEFLYQMNCLMDILDGVRVDFHEQVVELRKHSANLHKIFPQQINLVKKAAKVLAGFGAKEGVANILTKDKVAEGEKRASQLQDIQEGNEDGLRG
jgi:hypothetical protein